MATGLLTPNTIHVAIFYAFNFSSNYTKKNVFGKKKKSKYRKMNTKLQTSLGIILQNTYIIRVHTTYIHTFKLSTGQRGFLSCQKNHRYLADTQTRYR